MKFLVALSCGVLPILGMKIMRVSNNSETLLPRPAHHRTSTRFSSADDVIVFPDESGELTNPRTRFPNSTRPLLAPSQLVQKPTSQIGKFPVPMCEGGADFCEEVENYPSISTPENIRLPAEDLTTYLDADTILPLRVRPVNQIEEIPLCAAKEEIIHPRVAKNIEEEYMFILNDGDKYIQGVRLEKCIKPDEPCHDSINEAAPSGFTTRCRQKYLYKKLLALSNDGSTMIQSFKIPSCCVCHLIPTFFSPQARKSAAEEVVDESKPLASLRQEDVDAVDLS